MYACMKVVRGFGARASGFGFRDVCRLLLNISFGSTQSMFVGPDAFSGCL